MAWVTALIVAGLGLYGLGVAMQGHQWYIAFSAGIITGLGIVLNYKRKSVHRRRLHENRKTSDDADRDELRLLSLSEYRNWKVIRPRP
jgi:hypothetical protein